MCNLTNKTQSLGWLTLFIKLSPCGFKVGGGKGTSADPKSALTAVPTKVPAQNQPGFLPSLLNVFLSAG